MSLRKLFVTFTFFALLFCMKPLCSQVIIGLTSPNNAFRSLSLNPSLMNTSDLYLDIAVANVSFMVYNDYAYMDSRDALKAIFNKRHGLPTYLVNGKGSPFCIYDVDDKYPRNLYQSLDVNVLGIMYALNENQSIAFGLNTRVYTSALDVPMDILEISTFGIGDSSYYQKRYVSQDIKIASLEWNEIALSYSKTIFQRNYDRLDAGVSLKYLMGYSAAVADVKTLDYMLLSEDSILVNNMDADIMYSLPVNYSETFVSGNAFDKSLKRGDGFSLDIGMTYTKRKTMKHNRHYIAPCMMPKIEYKWKVGVSIMDIGFIRFNSNSVADQYYTNDPLLFDVNLFDNVENFDELSRVMHSIYDHDNQYDFSADDTFTIGLPTTFRLHFDYNIVDNYYVTLSAIQPFSLLKNSVVASSQLMLEPRYENSFFQLSMPITLEEYRFLNLGAMIRIGYFSVGTYNIMNYLGYGHTNGFDLFVSFRYFLDKGKCQNGKYDSCWSSNFGRRFRK